MVSDIDWGEFKAFRQTRNKDKDNFMMLLDFLKSYYNMFSVQDIYDTLRNDETAKMMLEKRDLNSVEVFEAFLFKV